MWKLSKNTYSAICMPDSALNIKLSLFAPLRWHLYIFFLQESESTNYGHGDDLVLLLSDSGLDSEAKLRTSDLMLAAWTNFAKAASPNPPNHRPANHTAAGQEKVYTAKTHKGKFETNISKKGIARSQSQFPHSCVWQRFIYSHYRSAYSAAGKYCVWTDSGIHTSLTETWIWILGLRPRNSFPGNT